MENYKEKFLDDKIDCNYFIKFIYLDIRRV